ncbi:sodium channel modifier 1 [Dryobates pubescens]|uniref:sodium channel modifier 1 n=1 Tax=Dryobates pubescens TaxID=118200 RepID=UPI0023B96C09|nr:sodium channel modifier 1 [Dryobates pubescens]
MSFKREGDDPGQLGVLQRRRIADLLANYIPEEEALLLRSGRYACTVCAHRPVFDTLEVLTVHRAGKKHQSSLQRFYGRKGSAQDVTQQHWQEEEVQAEEEGSPAPLLARTRRITHSALLKAAPYSSCCRRAGVPGSSSRAAVAQAGPTSALPLPEPPQEDRGATAATPVALLPGHRRGRADTPRAAAARKQRGGKGKASVAAPSPPQAPSPTRRQALERYLQLRSSGWLQDPSGKWVKDETVEFDSDEEEPPALLPPA